MTKQVFKDEHEMHSSKRYEVWGYLRTLALARPKFCDRIQHSSAYALQDYM